jgi:hypothetical protein
LQIAVLEGLVQTTEASAKGMTCKYPVLGWVCQNLGTRFWVSLSGLSFHTEFWKKVSHCILSEHVVVKQP